MIDLHCHILPGVDDGPATIEETVALARAAVAAGTRTMVATSHVSPRYPNDHLTIHRKVAEVSARLADEEIPLEIRPGGEVAVAQISELTTDALEALRLGGGPWLLVESPFVLVVDMVPPLLGRLQEHGHRIVLAHPERCPGFHRRPDLVVALAREHGVLMSVTAGSLAGRFGGDVAAFALSMARAGLIHNVASDAHDCERRPPAIAAPLERAGLGAHLELLAEAAPRAILAGSDLPPFPDTLLESRSRRLPWQRAQNPFAEWATKPAS